ncbi:putative ATPase [Clostridium sporogenes]|uniref:Uncharacterized protein n=1 Tax=Clostridium sporogenes TaxID=1509 RepID=A0A7U4XTF4_CLOSG|nr:hypothetical protein T258_3312 [Clostridium botulinum Prevot_594]AKC61470.1 hypothetical protein CLSPO_c07490 [Clostridium sporogenes]AKJ88797.1 hypothetical protein CLSPOx_03750 [Clostridium sporogenes]KCZ68775.1 hypothetical protein CSPO_4c03000 [Clostridium sporogenes]KRU41638.1 hypothetical protein VT94_21030 [Clostridium sporogenes]
MPTYTIFAEVNGAGKTSIYKSIYYNENIDEKRINTDNTKWSNVTARKNTNASPKVPTPKLKRDERIGFPILNWIRNNYMKYPLKKKSQREL